MQLPYVARPAVGAEHRLGLRREPHGRHHVLVGEIQCEFLEKQQDVAFPFAERRNGDGDRAQSIIEVFPELAVADGVEEVDIGGGYHADVCLLDLGRPDLDEFAGLQDAEQADLGRKRQFGHLVEEERSAVRLFEVALAGLDGAGERAFFMAEQFGVDGPFRDAAAVDGQINVMFARAVLVDDLRDDLLAHAALACDQHGEVRRRHLAGDFKGPFQLGVAADDSEALLDLIQIHICKDTKNVLHL